MATHAQRSIQTTALILVAVMMGLISARAEPSVENSAPTLIARGSDGQIFDLGKLRGKVVLVNYWATWCEPCRKEMPRLNAFYRHYHSRGLELIGISVDRGQRERAVDVTKSLSYPAAFVGDLTADGFGKPRGVPSTFVVDPQGIVRDKFIDVYDQLLIDVVLPLLPGGVAR